METDTILLTIIIIMIGAIGYFLTDKFGKFDKTFETLKYNLKAVANSLTKAKNIEFNHSHLKDYSPVSLTDKGQEYLQNLKFIEIFSNNSQEFFNVINLEEPTTKYDVEIAANKAVLSLLSEQYFNPIKVYFYNHPKEDIRGFAKIAGIYVRDKYFEANPEIKE